MKESKGGYRFTASLTKKKTDTYHPPPPPWRARFMKWLIANLMQ